MKKMNRDRMEKEKLSNLFALVLRKYFEFGWFSFFFGLVAITGLVCWHLPQIKYPDAISNAHTL